jgi:ankyrin repeat protein
MRTEWIFFIPCFCIFTSCTARPADPISKAAAQGDLTQLSRLLTDGASPEDRESALVWAARSGQPDAINLLVKNGADANAHWGVNDWTVLMNAIHKEQPQSVVALLDNGANVNARDPSGKTALMMAAGYGYTDIVRILLDHGADPKAALPNGENALDLAASGVMDIDRFTWGKCQSETVRLLRARVPDLRAKNSAKLKSCS